MWGGGIIPDIIVTPDTLRATELAAVQEIYAAAGGFRTELFDFAVSYIQDHPGLRAGFDLSAGDVNAFHGQVAAADIGVERKELQGADRFIRFQLEREIALQAWGDKGQFDQLRDRDEQLLAAVALLKGQTDSDTLVQSVVDFVEREGRVTRAAVVAESTGSR
jgi:hypothetical protein